MSTHPFDILPPALFQPLAAPSRRLYLTVLLRLFSLAQEAAILDEEAVVLAVLDVIATSGNEIAEWDAETQAEFAALEAVLPTEATDTTGETYRRQRIQARALLRRLEATGWLKREPQPDYQEHFIFPAYTFPLLEAFQHVTEQRPTEFEGLIYDAYLLAQRPDPHISGYVQLQQLHDRTRRIASGLKQLQHNIGQYIEALMQNLSVRDVLEHFSAYRADVAPNYHRLKTAEHLSRYRLDILQTVAGWLRNQGWLARAAQEAQRTTPDATAAEQQVYAQLEYIQRQFDQMNDLMTLIDERHSRYAEAVVMRVRYGVGGGLDLSTQIAALCRTLGAQPDVASAPAPAPLRTLFRLFKVDFINRRSLRPPAKARAAYQPPPLADVPLDAAALQMLQDAMTEELRSKIKPADAWNYLKPHLADREWITSAELPITGFTDWLCLIGLLLYADLPDCFYTLQAPPPEQPWLERGPYRCPNLQFVRK